jgi:hypothetical protein
VNEATIMHDDLRTFCATEFARHIDQLFGKYRIETYSPGEDWVEHPAVGLFRHVGDEAAAAALEELDRRALAARERFKTDGPAWAQPLPVSWNACCRFARIGELVEAGVLAPDNGRWELLGHFASSLLGSKWDPEHVSFDRFCRGMMADRSTRSYLRNDPELRRAYPPKPLPGLMSSEMAAALDLSEMRLAAKARRQDL